MLQAYADGVLFYDSRVEETDILGLSRTAGLNVSGTATIVLPPRHAFYNRFVGFKTVVEIYKDATLKFRGRALYPSDDFYNQRTITCEGERGFLRDAIHRPHVYEDDPASIFSTVIGLYNEQVDTFKRFKVGTVTVTDPNDYILLEASEAETVADTVDKLVERCGGYITFTYNEENERCINWLADLGYRSGQSIEFGENLLDFSRSDGSTGPITVLIPYGAKDEATGKRITIESETGVDYIEDAEAVAVRGRIIATKTWDDVTLPHNLLMKAQAELASAKNIITTLQLSAVDLSNLDKRIDFFQVGDFVRVTSAPHGVDEDFLLKDLSEDLLNPAGGSITLGKEVETLVGSDVAGDRHVESALHKVERNIRSDYQKDVAKILNETKGTLTSLIQQTEKSIMQEVSETFATNGSVESAISSRMTQLAGSFDFTFSNLEKKVDDNGKAASDKFEEIEKYIRFENGDIILGDSENQIGLRITDDRISFYGKNGAEVAYFSKEQLVVLDGRFLNSLRVGAFALLPRANGNLSLVKVG